jgi:hypothetical protein
VVTLPSGEVAYLGDPDTVTQEGSKPGEARQANLAYILDASGSMNAELPGTGQTKLAVAKEVMAELVPQIPAKMKGALWIYGHRYPQEPKEESCWDIERVFPLGPVDARAYQKKIDAITAIGYTPIADSIEQAARDLPVEAFNSIILVSDGEETCGGDPCALAEALKASQVAVTIHVVGYAVEELAQGQLQCIAQASGGTYHDAEDAAGLLQALEEAMAATVAETVLRVELIAPDGTEEGGNVRLYEAGTDRLVSSYATWTDNAVPPGVYDLLLVTLPPIVYQDLRIDEGSTTIVRIVLSAIRLLTPDGEETRFDLLDSTTAEWLGQKNGTVLLVPATYQVSVNNITSDPITLDEGETVEIILGAIKVVGPDGEEARFDLLDPVTDEWLSQENGIVFLLPGSYQVSVNDITSDPITQETGETVEIILGAIKVLDPDGEEARFDLFDPTTDEWLSQENGIVFLLPGTYQLSANDSFSDPITLDRGETVEVLLGAIKVLGPDGKEARFDLRDPATDEWLGQKNGLVFLLPGTYKVVLSDGSTFEKVVVKAGEVTEVE